MIGSRCWFSPFPARLVTYRGFDVAGDVPELVAEVTVSLYLAPSPALIVTGRYAHNQGHAQRIGAVLWDYVQRVNDRLRPALAHLFTVFGAHHAVQVDISERNLASSI